VDRFQDLKNPLLIIVSFFVVLLIYTQIFGPISFKVNSQPNLFYVDGRAKETAIPKTATLTIGVTENGSTVGVIQESLNTKSNKIVEELKKLGVKEKDIKTQSYSLYPNYGPTIQRLDVVKEGEAAPPSQPDQISGYTGTQNIEVKVADIAIANKALDVATKNGANIVSGASFALGDEEREMLEDKAREEAIKNAKDKASRITKSSGLRLGKLVNVSENQGPYPYAADQSFLKETSETDLNPGETTVEVTVTLTYETL
jgi:uncharacterized protein